MLVFNYSYPEWRVLVPILRLEGDELFKTVFAPKWLQILRITIGNENISVPDARSSGSSGFLDISSGRNGVAHNGRHGWHGHSPSSHELLPIRKDSVLVTARLLMFLRYAFVKTDKI